MTISKFRSVNNCRGPAKAILRFCLTSLSIVTLLLFNPACDTLSILPLLSCQEVPSNLLEGLEFRSDIGDDECVSIYAGDAADLPTFDDGIRYAECYFARISNTALRLRIRIGRCANSDALVIAESGELTGRRFYFRPDTRRFFASSQFSEGIAPESPCEDGNFRGERVDCGEIVVERELSTF